MSRAPNRFRGGHRGKRSIFASARWAAVTFSVLAQLQERPVPDELSVEPWQKAAAASQSQGNSDSNGDGLARSPTRCWLGLGLWEGDDDMGRGREGLI